MSRKKFGGSDPFVATLRNAFRELGVKNPVTNKPYTEAMLLGVGGGLGCGYILWEFKSRNSAIITLGYRHRWNYIVEFMSGICDRVGVNYDILETSGKKQAMENLMDALATEQPFIAWVDKAHLPHQNLPEELQGYGLHVVGVYGGDENEVHVDDLANSLYTIPMEAFAPARARIGSDKNRLMILKPSKRKVNLPKAIKTGIQAQIDYLGGTSTSFALPTLKKWAKLMVHTKDKKAWQVVFKERIGLYDTLRSIHEGITLDGTDGAGLRNLYADFLLEASKVLDNPQLKNVAKDYRKAAKTWQDLANTALPDSPAFLKKTKEWMNQRYEAYEKNETAEMQKVMKKLAGYQEKYNTDFKMKDKAVDELFEAIQEKLLAVHDAEKLALESLENAMK